jgi:hypothetical protein
MAKILVLVTSAEPRDGRMEWRGYWWHNVIRVDISDYAVGYYGIIGNGTNNDVLYAEDNRRYVERHTATAKEGLNYLLTRSGQSLATFLNSEPWQLIEGDNQGVVLIRGDEISAETREANLDAVKNAFENHQMCIVRHGLSGQEGDSFPIYTSTAEYWEDMMRLRYGGGIDSRAGEETVQDRTDAFDSLWEILGCKRPPKLEAYLHIMRDLVFDNKPDSDTLKKYDSDIQKTASDSERKEWQEIRKKIEDWEVSQRDVIVQNRKTNVKLLDEEFSKFAEKELIQHYPYLSDLE